MKIDRFKILNKNRGKATIMASFDVNFGPMTIRGYEIVKIGNGQPFVSEPANVYKKDDGSWDRFAFVVYNDAKGENMQNQIQTAAFDELRRRGPAATQPDPFAGTGAQDDPFGF